MSGRGLYLAPDDIREGNLAVLHVKAVDIDMIHTLIGNQQIFIVMCHSCTVDMRSEIPVCQTSETLVEDFVRDLADGAVLLQLQNRELSVMVTCYEQIAVRIVCGHITASHTVDRCKI